MLMLKEICKIVPAERVELKTSGKTDALLTELTC